MPFFAYTSCFDHETWRVATASTGCVFSKSAGQRSAFGSEAVLYRLSGAGQSTTTYQLRSLRVCVLVALRSFHDGCANLSSEHADALTNLGQARCGSANAHI